MNYSYKTPSPCISEYVQNILVIENYDVANPFTLPLFANGCPTLVFLNKPALISNRAASPLTLFGQTIQPGSLTINESFTLIAYFFKPHALLSLFHVQGKELTDTHIELNTLKLENGLTIGDRLLNSTSLRTLLHELDGFIKKLIDKKKYDTEKIAAATKLIQNNAAF